MAKKTRLILAGATLSAIGAVSAAQTAGQQGPANLNPEQQAAPVERSYPNQNRYAGTPNAASPANQTTVPIQGVMLRVTPQTSVQQVSESSDTQKFELRVDRGVVNVNIHDPGKDKLILVDLPGGQTQLLKNGLYTFNADTNTVRVLKGEALAFPEGAAPDAKPLKVKEYNKVVFNGTAVKPHEFVPYEASVDLLQGPRGAGEVYGYGPYGDGFYGYAPYPYYGYAYPWGYPYYGWGYPYPYGVGLGFGYVGGFHGGFSGGFHGGGFAGGHRGR